MIEVPRGALTADEIAEHAEFFSFGTNDLTQMAFGYSRDDAEGKFLLQYVDRKILPENPFQVLDREGVGQLVRMAAEKGRATQPRLEGRASAASTAATRAASPSATRSGSTTSAARRSGCRSPGWPPPRQRSPRRRRRTSSPRLGRGRTRRRRSADTQTGIGREVRQARSPSLSTVDALEQGRRGRRLRCRRRGRRRRRRRVGGGVGGGGRR